MKKIISVLTCLLALCSAAVSCFAAEYEESSAVHPPRVVDEAGLLTAAEELKLAAELDGISMRNNFDIVVVAVTDTGSKRPAAYADDYFDYNGYGFGDNRDGVLLLVGTENGDWWISTCGYGMTAFTDAGIGYIGSIIVPYMSDGDFYKAFMTYAQYCERFITLAKNGDPFDIDDVPKDPFPVVKYLAISVGTGFAVSLVIMLILRSQLRSVRHKSSSKDYTVPGSMYLTKSYDMFVTSHISRTEIPKNNSSGGSSAHRSSSGHSHGGGGGKF